MSMPCKATGPKDRWENKIATALKEDQWYQRNAGRDFVYMHSRYKWDMSKKVSCVCACFAVDCVRGMSEKVVEYVMLARDSRWFVCWHE